MKITALHVYPVKALRGISLEEATLGPQGIRFDRVFALFKVHTDSGKLEKVQLARFPQCSLFEQTLHGDKITVRYHAPQGPEAEAAERSSLRGQNHDQALDIPLEPDISTLLPLKVELHHSPASSAYAMGEPYDTWFGARFGFVTRLVYIGDGRREVLGSIHPGKHDGGGGGMLATVSSHVPKAWFTSAREEKQDVGDAWITFTDVAPFLITSEASLADVNARLAGGAEVGMYKFRPNIVVDGEGAWDEDFWAELSVVAARGTSRRITLTANCGRCTSVNVDYATGQPALGELGTVLKKMMKDRRVDQGLKYSPIFGRYGFLVDAGELHVAVGDDVDVTKRGTERTRFEWPGLT